MSLELLYLDIEEVLEDLKVYWQDNKEYEYNPNAFNKITDKGDNIMCCCPYHVETNPSFGIRKDYPYAWNCFQCEIGGTLIQLVQHVLGYANEVVAEHFILKNYSEILDKRPSLNIEDILDKKSLDRKVSHLDSELDNFIGKRHPYLYSRGFTEHTLNKYEIGYDEYSRSMVIPVRASNGNIRFFKRRYVDRKGFLNEKNIDKCDIIYGLYYIMQAKTRIKSIYLTESETDCISMYQGGYPAGALMGKILYKEQIKELLKAGIEEVKLMLDNDLAGLEGCLQAYEKLSKYPIRVSMVIYPGLNYGINTNDVANIKYKDANDLLKANKLKDIKTVNFLEFLSMLNKVK